MKGDFSRDTFGAGKHFSRVMMQQGRVTLDADANEQSAILLHYLRTLARDLIGPYAAPVEHSGFQLSFDEDETELKIGAGRYYVDGILVENDGTVVDGENRDYTYYTSQPDYRPPDDDPFRVALKDESESEQDFCVYLDVWERHITSIEDEAIREKALAGPDTCTRAKVVWQVKALPVDDTQTCDKALAGLMTISHAKLTARVDPGQGSDSPCTISPEAKYRGAENHLYRVEIQTGGEIQTEGKSGATFKWSRDNGSVATALLGISGYELKVAQARGFTAGCWVELSDDISELQGEPGVLVQLAKVEGRTLTIDKGTVPSSGLPAWSGLDSHPKVRRWDQVEDEGSKWVDGAILVQEGNWIDLEDGVQVKFDANGEYRTGDYWLIPARVSGDSGDIEWPSGQALPPSGVVHHYAPLGFVSCQDKQINSNCRCEFEPLSSCFGMGSIATGAHLLASGVLVRAAQTLLAPKVAAKTTTARKKK